MIFKPSIISRYIFREILGPFFVSLGVFTFVLLMARGMQMTSLIVSRGLGMDIVALLFFYVMPYFFVFTIPMATMLGILLGLLRMNSNNEITALKSSGLSLWQMLPPVAALAFLAWLASFALSLWAMPWADYKFEQLLLQTARERADLALQDRVFLNRFPGLLIYINRLSDNGMLDDIFIIDERDGERQATIIAKSGQIVPGRQENSLTIRLHEGSIHSITPTMNAAQTATFTSYDLLLTMAEEAAATLGAKRVRDMYLSELYEYMDKNPPGGISYNLAEIELHSRFSMPAGCLVLALMALLLGVNARGGRSLGVVASLAVFLFYYLLLTLGRALGAIMVISPALSMWLPNLILALAGLLLFRRELQEKQYAWLNGLSDLSGRLKNLLSRRF
jgi:lipopolysaccharide export system permease protein